MSTDIKPIITIVLGLAVSTAAQARDYIPPPTGPYQSSVVINQSQTDDSKQQVYKFPPADILMDDRKPRSEYSYQPEPEMHSSGQPATSTMAEPPLQQQQPPMVNSQHQQPMPESNAYSPWQLPQGGQAAGNPEWYGYQGAAPNYNQNVWQQAPGYGYGYQQQYPYSYGTPNQYNGAYTPFNGMPSPWNVMPKNPFFSDR